MRYFILAVLMVFLIEACGVTNEVQQPRRLEPFAASYEKIESLQNVANRYKLLIVEPDNYSKGEVDTLNTTENTLLGYISLGEVNRFRWYYPLMEERGFLGVNENWDSPYLNLADPVTRSILLDQVLPNIMIKGFDGLFLDTIDNVAPYTERSHLQPYMLDIIAEMRERYPDAVIIQNAGLFMLDQTQEYVDAVLVEDVATLYDFEGEQYRLRSVDEFREKVKQLTKNESDYGKPFLIIDFAKSAQLRSEVVNRLDTLDFPYFISTIELDDISQGISSQR